jgi:hypothetical protein
VALIVDVLRIAEANDGRHDGKSVAPTKKAAGPNLSATAAFGKPIVQRNVRADFSKETTPRDVGFLAVSAASGHKSRVNTILGDGATQHKSI